MNNKALFRTVISLALCLIVCTSLLCIPAFAVGNTLVIIGEKIDKPESSEPTNSVVVGNSGSGVSSSPNSGIVSDGSATQTHVIVGSKIEDSSQKQPNNAIVVQSDGKIIAVRKTEQKQENTATTAETLPVAETTVTAEPTGLAAELHAKVNETRTRNGVGTLKYSGALQSIADTRAKESSVSFGHTRPDGSHCSTAVTVDYQITGENLIQVTSAYATADIMMETWMNSDSHRYNILLASFTDMAVGIYMENDTTYVSMIFIG